MHRTTNYQIGQNIKRLGNRLLTWLKNKIIGGSKKYLKIAASSTWLKIKNQAVKLIPQSEVPEKHRPDTKSGVSNAASQLTRQTRNDTFHDTNQEEEEEDREKHRDNRPDRPKLTDEGLRQARTANLEDLHAEEVARRAARNVNIRNDVYDNPGLIDADSEWEADIKIKLARGQDITGEIESNPQLDMDTVMGKMGLEWAARAGKNAMSTSQMVSALNGENGDSGEAGAEVGTAGPTTDVGDYSGSNSAAESSSTGYTSALSGGSLSGVGSLDISTSTGTGSAASTVGSATGSVGTGTGTGTGGSGY